MVNKRHRLQLVLLTVVCVSGYQYLTQGSITWHRDILATVSGTLEDYATRPEAGWRRAGEQVESWGARREGDAPILEDLQDGSGVAMELPLRQPRVTKPSFRKRLDDVTCRRRGYFN